MENNAQQDSRPISILDLILVLLERKKLILIVMSIVSIVAVVGTGFIPKEYEASAVILPTKAQAPHGLGSLANDLPVSGLLQSLDLFGGSDNDQFVSILESGRLAGRVINQFNLAERYKFTRKKSYFAEDLVKRFNKYYSTEETDLDNITVSFIDKDPQFAADVVNFIVTQLDSISYNISKQSARYSREFFERRLTVVKEEMDSAYKRFNEFKLKHKYLDLEEQLTGTIEALSKIEGERMALDIQIQQLVNRFGAENNKVKELKRDRNVITNRIKHYMNEGSGELIVALNKTPDLGVEYAHLFRNVKVQETLHNYLVQMYEQSRLTEVNNIPSVRVLDAAVPPTKKMRPKRGALCVLAFFLAFMIVSTYVLLSRWYESEKKLCTSSYGKLKEVFLHLMFKK